MFGGLACCFIHMTYFINILRINKQTTVSEHLLHSTAQYSNRATLDHTIPEEERKKTVHKKYINTVHWKRKSNDACSWIIGTSLNRNELNYNKNISNGFYFLSVFVVFLRFAISLTITRFAPSRPTTLIFTLTHRIPTYAHLAIQIIYMQFRCLWLIMYCTCNVWISSKSCGLVGKSQRTDHHIKRCTFFFSFGPETWSPSLLHSLHPSLIIYLICVNWMQSMWLYRSSWNAFTTAIQFVALIQWLKRQLSV